MRIQAWHIIVLAIFLFIAYQSGWLTNIMEQFKAPEHQSVVGEEMVSVNKPLLISVVDPVGGSAVSGATVYIYEGTTLRETLTTDTSGQAQTSLRYTSGTMLNILVVNGNSKAWYSVIVPRMISADAESSTYNYVSIDFFTLGSYTLKVMDQFGNVYTDGGTINFTQLGTDTVTLTIMIYNNNDNTGYKSSHDPINNVEWKAVLLGQATDPDFILQGFERIVSRGSDSYYLKVIPDNGLIRQKIGNTYVKEGVYSFTVTLQKGALASPQTLSLTLYGYFDPSYFEQTGIGSNDQVQLATMSLTIAP